jgi:hypothetical protein
LDNSSILLNSSLNNDDPVASFCNDKNPTLEKFLLVPAEEDKIKLFKEFLSNAPEDEYLTHLVYTILKLSSLGEQSLDAQKISLELFKEAFDYAKNKNRVSYDTIDFTTYLSF